METEDAYVLWKEKRMKKMTINNRIHKYFILIVTCPTDLTSISYKFPSLINMGKYVMGY